MALHSSFVHLAMRAPVFTMAVAPPRLMASIQPVFVQATPLASFPAPASAFFTCSPSPALSASWKSSVTIPKSVCSPILSASPSLVSLSVEKSPTGGK